MEPCFDSFVDMLTNAVNRIRDIKKCEIKDVLWKVADHNHYAIVFYEEEETEKKPEFDFKIRDNKCGCPERAKNDGNCPKSCKYSFNDVCIGVNCNSFDRNPPEKEEKKDGTL